MCILIQSLLDTNPLQGEEIFGSSKCCVIVNFRTSIKNDSISATAHLFMF